MFYYAYLSMDFWLIFQVQNINRVFSVHGLGYCIRDRMAKWVKLKKCSEKLLSVEL